jgi:hypothetical protein
MKKWFVNNIYNFLINYPYNIMNSTVCKIGVEALAVDDLGLNCSSSPQRLQIDNLQFLLCLKLNKYTTWKRIVKYLNVS